MTEHMIQVANAERAEAHDAWLTGRLNWIGRRWGSECEAFVAWHYAEWDGDITAAETWAGMQWGLFDGGARDLDEAAALEDIQGERAESQATMALAHGF